MSTTDSFRFSKNRLLWVLFSGSLVPREYLRLAGNSYGRTGRVVSSLISSGFAEELSVFGSRGSGTLRVVRITARGIAYLCDTYGLDRGVVKEFLLSQQKNLKSREKKIVQLRYASTMVMLSHFLPSYPKEYYEFFQENLLSPFLNEPDSTDFVLVLPPRAKQIYAKRVFDKETGFVHRREMYASVPGCLKNITSSRFDGLLKMNDRYYTVYNHWDCQKKGFGSGEEKCQLLLERYFCGSGGVTASLSFGKSYKIVRSAIFAKEQRDGRYLFRSGLYNDQYFIPLTGDGIKQLTTMMKPNYREALQAELIAPGDIERSEGSFFDGISEDGERLYIGVDCNISEITKIWSGMDWLSKFRGATIFCYPWQEKIYRTIFCTEYFRIKIIPYPKQRDEGEEIGEA